MSVIGHFRREGDGFVGRVATLSLDAVLKLVPSTRAVARGPDFLVLLGEQEVGAAWRASDLSGALLNIKLDDPAWPDPANVRLMAAEDGLLPMTWIRRSEEKPADKNGDRSASPPGSD